jgi:hypothetical protein
VELEALEAPVKAVELRFHVVEGTAVTLLRSHLGQFLEIGEGRPEIAEAAHHVVQRRALLIQGFGPVRVVPSFRIGEFELDFF